MDIYLRYIGDGFLPEIPARDLTRDEFGALSVGQQAAALNSGLYELTDTKKKTKKSADKESEA